MNIKHELAEIHKLYEFGDVVEAYIAVTAIVERLLEHLDVTADGYLVAETDKFYCPNCGSLCREVCGTAYCDECPNPDDCNTIPLPLFLDVCYAKKENIPV